MGPQKQHQRHHRAPQQRPADATDASSGTPTRRGHRRAQGCTRSTRQKLGSTPRRPERDRGRAPHQANPSAAARRWRGPGDHSDSADQRQIASTARACGPPAPSAGPARSPRLDAQQRTSLNHYPEPGTPVGRIAPLPPRRAPATSTRRMNDEDDGGYNVVVSSRLR